MSPTTQPGGLMRLHRPFGSSKPLGTEIGPTRMAVEGKSALEKPPSDMVISHDIPEANRLIAWPIHARKLVISLN